MLLKYMENLGILVGYGCDFEFGGKKEIASALRNKGYSAKEIDEPWPRDKYVFFKGKYVSAGEEGVKGNVYGEGGNIRIGEGFMLISDNAFNFDKIKSKVDFERLGKDKEYYNSSKKIIIEEGKKYHNSRIYVAPTGNFNGKIAQGHIDLFTLLLLKRKILILDKHFGKDANRDGDYNAIAEKEGLEFIEYDGSQDGVWYPLNSLVLPRGGGEIAVIDSKAISLQKLLHKKGIETIGVHMPQRNHPAGKINCQTNVFNVNDKNNIERFFD
jgi:hypothetical protein